MSSNGYFVLRSPAGAPVAAVLREWSVALWQRGRLVEIELGDGVTVVELGGHLCPEDWDDDHAAARYARCAPVAQHLESAPGTALREWRRREGTQRRTGGGSLDVLEMLAELQDHGGVVPGGRDEYARWEKEWTIGWHEGAFGVWGGPADVRTLAALASLTELRDVRRLLSCRVAGLEMIRVGLASVEPGERELAERELASVKEVETEVPPPPAWTYVADAVVVSDERVLVEPVSAPRESADLMAVILASSTMVADNRRVGGALWAYMEPLVPEPTGFTYSTNRRAGRAGYWTSSPGHRDVALLPLAQAMVDQLGFQQAAQIALRG